MESARTGRRTREATRELLEYLITRGTIADLENADPEWLKAPPSDEGAFEWYSQFGDATKVMRGRDELLQMVIELQRSSKAPAARVLNAAAWFDEWVELPQPALGLRSPSQVLCTPVGLEAAKVILRALQEAARASQAAGPKVGKRIRGVFRVFGVALVSIAVMGLAASPAVCAAEEGGAAVTKPLEVVVLPARAHVMRAGFVQTEEVAEWSAAARANLDVAIEQLVADSPAFSPVGLPELSSEERAAIGEFVAVANLATTKFDGFTWFGGVEVQRTAADRTLGPSLAFLHDRTGADYAIGAFALQVEQSKRSATVTSTVGLGLVAVGSGFLLLPTVTFSYVALFMADLRTGELRWFNVRSGYEVAGYNFSDLRDAESARKMVGKLLEEYPDVPREEESRRASNTGVIRPASPEKGGFAVQMPAGWRASQLGDMIRSTRDGRGLNEISIELREHNKAFPLLGRRTTRESSPAQLAKAFIAELEKQQLDELQVIDVSTDARLVGQPGFRVHYSYRLPDHVGGARLQLVTIGTVVPRGLLVAQLRAPQLEYFDKALPAFEESIQTIVLKPRRNLN